MTQPTNTFDSYDAVGNREDLSDIIYDISPTDTPFMSGIEKAKAENTLHEWQTDSLAAATDANAQVEGDNASGDSRAATTRLSNKTQISRKVVVVSGTQEAINHAGRASERAYQIAKSAKELKRDMEKILTGNQTQVTGNATTARKLRPLCGWYATNDVRGTSGADGTAATQATDGTQREFTETLLKSAVQKAWTAGGDPDCLMVGPVNKQKVSGFTGNSTRMDKGEDKRLVAAIDIYESDFGALKVVPNRFQRERDAHVLQMDMWGLATLRPFMTSPLAKTGDAETELLVVEYTLEARNEAANAVVADLTTS